MPTHYRRRKPKGFLWIGGVFLCLTLLATTGYLVDWQRMFVSRSTSAHVEVRYGPALTAEQASSDWPSSTASFARDTVQSKIKTRLPEVTLTGRSTPRLAETLETQLLIARVRRDQQQRRQGPAGQSFRSTEQEKTLSLSELASLLPVHKLLNGGDITADEINRLRKAVERSDFADRLKGMLPEGYDEQRLRRLSQGMMAKWRNGELSFSQMQSLLSLYGKVSRDGRVDREELKQMLRAAEQVNR